MINTKFFKLNINLFTCLGVVNGPPKNESLGKFYPSLRISQNQLMGLRVSDFVSVGHIYAFLSSHYTFSSQARILRCQSRCLGESWIYHSPRLCLSGHDCLKCDLSNL